jgi:hypothetical protein
MRTISNRKLNSMKKLLVSVMRIVFIIAILATTSCKKIKKFRDENPDLAVLEQGFKSSVAIGYCASLAHMAFTGNTLPENVIFKANNPGEFSKSGLIYVKVSEANPLPSNKNVGDIVIAALWDESDHSGVMSILFADIDLLNAEFKFYGLHTVPFIEEDGTGDIITVFAEQDIIIGEGNDTIINLSMSRPQFNLETDRAKEPEPDDVFAAVKQKVWFVKIDQSKTYNDIYDDTYIINGGGQIAEVTSSSGGIQYHALIGTTFNYAYCSRNPTSGNAFIQNIKAGDNINLGDIFLDFHDICDGQAYVDAAAGSYFPYFHRDVNLNFE